MAKLNLACGGDILGGEWINADKFLWNSHVVGFDYDKKTVTEEWGENYFDEILCKGALMEFEKNPIEIFSDLHTACVNGALITIVTAVVDTQMGAFRDPVAKHHYHSEWAQYIGGSRISGGQGFGLKGNFEIISNDIGGEVQTVTFRVIK